MGRPHTEASKAKLAALAHERARDPAYIKKLVDAAAKRSISDETRAKMVHAARGKKKPPAQAFNIAASMLGLPASLVLGVQADMVRVAELHEIDMQTLRRIASSRSTVTAHTVPPEFGKLKLTRVETATVAAAPLKCLGCGKRPRPPGRFQCEICAARSDEIV